MSLILTSECCNCAFGTMDDSNKARVKIYCSKRDKEYYYGQYIDCDDKLKRSKNE